MNNKESSKKIEFKLINLLKAKNMTKTQLSEMSGVPYRTIVRICNGETKSVNLENLYDICYALNCSLNNILDFKTL